MAKVDALDPAGNVPESMIDGSLFPTGIKPGGTPVDLDSSCYTLFDPEVPGIAGTYARMTLDGGNGRNLRIMRVGADLIGLDAEYAELFSDKLGLTGFQIEPDAGSAVVFCDASGAVCGLVMPFRLPKSEHKGDTLKRDNIAA